MKTVLSIIISLIVCGLCVIIPCSAGWIWTNITYDDNFVPSGGWQWIDNGTPGPTPTPTQPDFPEYLFGKGTVSQQRGVRGPAFITNVTILDYSGNVSLVSPDNPSQKSDVYTGMPIFDESLLITGQKSYAKIQIAGGPVITLPPLTTIIIGNSTLYLDI